MSDVRSDPLFAGSLSGHDRCSELGHFGGQVTCREIWGARGEGQDSSEELGWQPLIAPSSSGSSWNSNVRTGAERACVLLLGVPRKDVPNAMTEFIVQKNDVVYSAGGSSNAGRPQPGFCDVDGGEIGLGGGPSEHKIEAIKVVVDVVAGRFEAVRVVQNFYGVHSSDKQVASGVLRVQAFNKFMGGDLGRDVMHEVSWMILQRDGFDANAGIPGNVLRFINGVLDGTGLRQHVELRGFDRNDAIVTGGEVLSHASELAFLN
jgi:hypothetical protein